MFHFSPRLKEKRATFCPNMSPHERSLPQERTTDGLLVDKHILRSATELAVRRNRASEDASEAALSEERVQRLEKGMKLLANQQNHIIELLGALKKD